MLQWLENLITNIKPLESFDDFLQILNNFDHDSKNLNLSFNAVIYFILSLN